MSSGLFANGVQKPLRTVWRVQSGYRSVSYWWPKETVASCEKKGSASSKGKVLFMVPGNPGIPEYYIEFLSSIHENLGDKLDIVLVGHHGQSVDDYDTYGYQDKNFGLQDQVNHKLECLDALVEKYPADTEYFLAGHSVGAWICEQIIKQRPKLNIIQTFSLFPALRKLRETENGSWMSKLLFPPLSRAIISKIAYGLNVLPLPLIVRSIAALANQSWKNALITSLTLLKPSVAESALSMAFDEMEHIYEVDAKFYAENVDKFTFYYGCGDKWVPEESYHEMKAFLSSGNVMLCSENVPHAFVLAFSSVMAKKMIVWLHKYID